MGNQKYHTVLTPFSEVTHHPMFGRGVEGGCGFVKNQNRCVAYNGTSNRKTLALSG